MERIQIEKNRLDLAYQRRMQHQNAILVFMTTSIFSFIGSILFAKEQRSIGIIIAITLFGVSLLLYRKLETDLRAISNQIASLK